MVHARRTLPIVKLSQGDLMLCPSCEAARFPEVAKRTVIAERAAEQGDSTASGVAATNPGTDGKVSNEVLETILLKITEKFTAVLNSRMNQFRQIMNETVNIKLAAISERLIGIETQVSGLGVGATNIGAAASNCAANVSPDQSLSFIAEATSRSFLQLEKEKEEIRKRSRNVFITGLARQSNVTDAELVAVLGKTVLM
jgi:hypothetical protein